MLDTRLPDPATSEAPSAFGEASPAGEADGYVELCGPLEVSAGGWLISGWARRSWREQTRDCVTLQFADGATTGSASTCFFGRGDLRDGAVGFLLHLHAEPQAEPLGPLRQLAVRLAGETLRLAPARAALPSSAAQLREEVLRLATEVGSRQARAMLRAWIDPPPFIGRDTLTPLGRPVRVQIEAAFRAPPDGLVLLGWLDDPAAVIAAVHLRCGDRVMPLDDTTMVRLPRRDVADDGEPDRGFVTWLPRLGPPDAPVALQIRFSDGEIAYLPIPDPARAGLAAMQQVLGGLHLHPAALAQAMATVVGPALEALNTQRLTLRPGVQDLCFGPPPDAARCSVIIPLAGPADALEWRLALLSEAPHHGIEFLFVLDGPALAEAVARRAHTCFARFGLPFRLLLLDRTVGHAPACNLAAKLATGQHLAFLDPACLPDHPGWLDRLLTALAQDPHCGAVLAQEPHRGAVLAQDHRHGAVLAQGPHRGAVLAPDHRHGASFAQDPHCGVALALDHHRGAVGGSAGCLVMATERFAALGGLDEAFILGDGDLEDLTHRLRASGLRHATVPGVSLTRLQREPAPLWRRNLAVYNAWQMHRRWPQGVGCPPAPA